MKVISKAEFSALKIPSTYPVIADDRSLNYIRIFEHGSEVDEERYASITWIANKITVAKVMQREKDRDIFFELSVLTAFGEETKIVPMALLHKKDFVNLKSWFVFREKYADCIIEYILKSSENAPHLILYNEVGWFKTDDNNLFFRADKVISADSSLVEKYNYDGDLKLDNLISTKHDYTFTLNSFLITEGTMFAIVAGLSSAIIGLLRQTEDIDNLLIHLYGDSSSGKSTFLKLALSCWGKPNEPPLFSEWNSTVNAIYAMLFGNNGIAVGLDEASSVRCDFTTLIYNLAHGRDKAKCSTDSTLRELKTWNTTIISTAEESLIDKTAKNNGIRARCFELFELQVTKDARHAEAINSFIINNYGVLGEKLIRWLEAHKSNSLVLNYKTCLSYIRLKFNGSTPISDRAAKSYAVLLLTAFYARDIGVNIDVRKIVSVLEKRNESLIEETKSAEDLREAICSYVINNINRFPAFNKLKFSSDINCEGYINGTELTIMESVFRRIAYENRFTDVKMAAKWLLKANYLKKGYKDRHYVQRTINKIQVKCYIIKLPSVIEDTQPVPAPAPPKRIIRSKMTDEDLDF